MNYFTGCDTIDEIKKRYRELAKKHHPDRGSSHEIFVDIGNQYDQAIKSNIDDFLKDNPNKQYSAKGQFEEAEIFKKIIEELNQYDFIELEITGWWLWVTLPKEKREILKDLKDSIDVYFSWHRTKQKWYYKPKWYYSNSRGSWTMDKIRNRYGSEIIKKDKKKPANVPALT